MLGGLSGKAGQGCRGKEEDRPGAVAEASPSWSVGYPLHMLRSTTANIKESGWSHDMSVVIFGVFFFCDVILLS